MAKVIQKFLLRPRGVVHTELLPIGSSVTRIAIEDGSPYAWVWMDPAAPRDWLVDFLVVCTGDQVEDADLYWPVNSFAANDLRATIWHGLSRWRKQVTTLLEQHAHG